MGCVWRCPHQHCHGWYPPCLSIFGENPQKTVPDMSRNQSIPNGVDFKRCPVNGVLLEWFITGLTLLPFGNQTWRIYIQIYITLHYITSHTYDFRLPFSLDIFQSSTIPSFHHSPPPRDSPTTSVTSIIVDLDLNLL